LAHFRRKKNFYFQFCLAIICFLDQSGILHLHNTICTHRYRCPRVNPNTLAWLQTNLITRLKKKQQASVSMEKDEEAVKPKKNALT
jgi:hypothetical protein